MTTKEFLTVEADNIINDLIEYWSVQNGVDGRYVNSPFPDKNDFIYEFETSIDCPYEEIDDAEDVIDVVMQNMIAEEKTRISTAYDKVASARENFLKLKEE